MVLNFLIGLTILIFLFVCYRHLQYNKPNKAHRLRHDKKHLTKEQIEKDFEDTFSNIKNRVSANWHEK